ncbi:hypothetical protein GMORB2_3492, partial [Geosmithia morbida]
MTSRTPGPSRLDTRGPAEDAIYVESGPNTTVVEAWGEGMHVGALAFVILIVLCNYRKHILLHKLILLELLLAILHGFYIFFPDDTSSWVLSGTAVLLYISYTIHNVVAWIKIKPFLPRWGGLLFIMTLMLVQPFWVLEMWANFAFFNDLGPKAIFRTTRCLESLMRDPWWIYTTVKLVRVINNNYGYSLFGLVHISPRFAILIMCMFVSIIFVVVDTIVSVTERSTFESGVNPFWRLALVFKCASDAFFLDDFKSVLDRIATSAMQGIANVPSGSMGGVKDDSAVRGPFRRGHRHLSSLGGMRRQGVITNHQYNTGHGARVEHVSLRGDSMDEEAAIVGPSPPQVHSRDMWMTPRFSTHCHFDDDADVSGARPPGQILAETTITISED